MNDLIRRQAAIDALKVFMVISGRRNEKSVALKIVNEYANIIKQKIEQLPSAEPEIIHCKDCLMHSVCRFERGLGLEGYCSQAERRAYHG